MNTKMRYCKNYHGFHHSPYYNSSKMTSFNIIYANIVSGYKGTINTITENDIYMNNENLLKDSVEGL